MSILNLNNKREPKLRTPREIFADIDALVSELAKTGVRLEDILEVPTPLQFEVRHGVMLAVVAKRLCLPCPSNFAHPSWNPNAGRETR